MVMRGLLVVLACIVLAQSHIYASDSKITYDYEGDPQIYHIFLALETGLGADDILHISLPLVIHSGTDKTAVVVKLISFSNSLEIVETNFLDYPASSTDSEYYVTFGVALSPNKWYEIQMYPNADPVVSLPFHGLIQVFAISSTSTNYITYDSNLAFGFIAVEDRLGSPGTLTVAASSSSTEQNKTSSIYTILIDITPSMSSSLGGNFTLEIHYDSGDANHNTGTGLTDFSFMGLCQSVTPNSGAAAILNSCEISDDLTKIYFSVNTLTAAQPIRISTQVSNPLFVSTRGIGAFYVDFVSGVVMENGYDSDALTVDPIDIEDPGSTRLYILWGIESDYTDAEVSDLSLGFYKASGSNIGPFNSFNAGFEFSETSPIDGRYRVSMKLGATGFLEGSIAHNLPPYSDLEVYCHYNTVTEKLICENVGPFINTGYRYFISGKVYFDSGTASSISDFGDVEIDPIVYDQSGVELPVSLYNDLVSADTITIHASEQLLDISGYHSTSTYKVGMAQVVSFQDDGTLSSTANAMKGFMQGTNSTIGVVPDLGVSQQLLFLLKANPFSGGSGNQIHYRLLYNNKVIGFQSGSESRGLDFVGYENGSGEWSIEFSPCHRDSYVVCEKYNADTPSKNVQIRVNTTTNFYGLYKFECGDAYTGSAPCYGGDCLTACNMFTGHGTSDFDSAIMSMRKVTFDSTQFHSSLYADDSLLDFVIVFLRGSTIMSTALINAYTMVGAPMQNIKASYVNYYDRGSGNSFNRGMRIPTMIRIAGGVLPTESRGATVMGVFFDDNVDAHTFYTTKDEAYDIGCSTNNCKYYPNTGINLHLNDIWHTNRRVQFYDLPPIQNQFNLLVPVTPSVNRYASQPLPDTLTIAFFAQNHTIGDVTGLLQTVSVFRLFGTAVTESISGSISVINSLSLRSSAGPNQYFTDEYYEFAGSIGFYLNTSNINQNPPNNTFGYGYSSDTSFGSSFGAGVTITSFYYNIFESSTLAFQSVPDDTAETCSVFGYVYNEQVSGNEERDNQWVYTAFCPIDGDFNTDDSSANIHFYNPQYPIVMTKNFPLQSIITNAYSDQSGMLVAYRQDTGTISSFLRTCTTSKLQAYNPSSSGKQRATFTVSTPEIRMSASGYDGYPQFRVQIILPSISNIAMQSGCHISEPDLSCTASGSPTSNVYVTYTGSDVLTVTYFEIQLYAVTSGSLGTPDDYTLNIYLPQQRSGTFVPFGDSFNSHATHYCQCLSTFKIGNTAYGTSMNFDDPEFSSQMSNVKSPISFNFGSYSYRETFFDTSHYQFNFGFLSTPANTDKGNSNFRCMVYENDDGVMTLSDKWATLDLTSLASVELHPKQEIQDPSSILFSMQCFGSGVPTGGDTTSMSLIWTDNSDTVQQAANISYGGYLPAATGTVTASVSSRRFYSEGMKSFYTFQIQTNTPLDENSKIYFDFHFNLGSRLDREGSVECYTRLNSADTDIQAVFSYCEFTSNQQLVLWNNQDVTSNTNFYVDIFNIQLPKSTDTTPNKIVVTVDADSDYSGGVNGSATITDSASSSAAIIDMHIISTSLSNNYIRNPHDITIQFDTVSVSVLSGMTKLYLLLPPAYGQWISRGQTLDHATDECYLQEANNAGVNMLNACTFISKRILKMTIGSTTSSSEHTLILRNIYSPSKLPEGRFNQYRFKLFVADGSENEITHYTFTDYSLHLTLQPDASLTDLSWLYHDIMVSDSLITLTDISDQTFIVYMGYYSNVIELRQSIYPLNFQIQMTLDLTSHTSNQFISKDGLVIALGSMNGYLRLAANGDVTNAGLYTLQYTKSGDSNSEYTAIPPLTVVVSNKKCELVSEEISYTLPLGGHSLPIRIDGIKCIPINSITVELAFDHAEVTMNSDLSSNTLTPSSEDGQLYLVLNHANRGGLAIGDTVTATFSITGDDAEYYSTIPSISIDIVDPASFYNKPVAQALTSPTLSDNQATFTLQCNMASTIYWSLGIYPSILNTEALDIQARIIASGGGLQTNYTEIEDKYMKVYGINYVPTTQTILKTTYNLKSSTEYIFKYFCMNQLGIISDSQSVSFSSLNYGAYLMKVSITFQGSINYGQYHDLSCSLAENFQIPYSRIMTEVMHYCNGKSTTFYPNDSVVMANEANSDGEFVYNFYILPDYSVPVDSTNSDIRSALALSSTSTTIIESTVDSGDLPELIQMQTEDIQVFTTPTIQISDPLTGLNSVSLSAIITNMNGFIIVACMDGVFDSSTMTLPTTTNIKKGLLEENINLKQVKMMYAVQNYNVSVEFTDLPDNTQFTFFYYGTSEDPTLTAQSTTVNDFNAKTLEALTVNINWQSHFTVLSLLLVLFILIQ